MADSEPNNNATDDSNLFVDPNTDDLEAFNRLMTGKAKVAPEKTEEAKPKEADPEPKVDTSEPDENKTNEPEENQDEGEQKPDGEEPPKPEKKVNRYQERINELTAKAREAERREQEVQRKLDELDRRSNPQTPAPTVAQKDDSPEPDAKNEDGSDKYPLGEFDPAYIRDLTRHTIQKEQAAATERFEKEQTQRVEKEAREQLQTQWAEKLTSVTETHEDFLEKTMELEDTFEGLDPSYSDYLVQTIKSLDHGPEVLYHFANNLAEAQKFVKLGPLAATLALGEVNAKFRKNTEDPKPTPAKVTKAPVPPQVNKGSATRTNVSGDTDDLDAFSRAFFKRGG